MAGAGRGAAAVLPGRRWARLAADGLEADAGDAGYQGMGKRVENADKPIDWHVTMRPSVRRAL